MSDDINLLDHVSIASPCPASWDQMQGDDRSRFCKSCQLTVYNLSNMTEPEAEALIKEKEGRLCARFYRRADGTILTRNCPVGWRKAQLRFRRFVGSICAACVALICSAPLLGWRGNGASRLREMEPFSRISAWLAPPLPPPAPRTPGVSRLPVSMGDVAISPPARPLLGKVLVGSAESCVPASRPEQGCGQ